MKTLTHLLLMVLLWPAFAGAQDHVEDTIVSYIDEFAENTEVAIAMLDKNEVRLIGFKKVGREYQKIDNANSVFDIGSVSKVFTSLLFVQAVSDGKLQVDGLLRDQFDFPIADPEENPITLGQLSNHTSGMPRLPPNINMADFSNPYKNYNEELLIEYLKGDLGLEREPGTRYSYSNLGSGLLGYIVSRAYGKSYNELLKEHIFGPLEMNSSTALLDEVDKARQVLGLNAMGEPVINWDMNALAPAGAIKSSISDMALFARYALSDNALLIASQKPTAEVTENLNIGLGWHISYNGGKTVCWHNGAVGGYRSCMAINRSDGQAVVVLSNISAFHLSNGKVDALCFRLLRGMAGM